MPRNQSPLPIPAYGLHRATGQARVVLRGRNIYLGRHGSPESWEKYRRLIADYVASGGVAPQATPTAARVLDVTAAFLRHADMYYRRTDGASTGEAENYRLAFKPLEELFGHSRVAEVGARGLRLVQQRMIELGWCRTHINRQINRVRAAFKWAVAHELIAANDYHPMTTVAPLKNGRSAAGEAERVRPVPEAHIEVVRPYLSRQVRAMVQLQLLTGARAGEVAAMRAVDLDTSGPVWLYTPAQHKNAHRGHVRSIHLGPRAQAVVAPFLAGRAVDAYLFSPTEAEAERRELLHSRRMTAESRGNTIGTNRRDRPRRRPRDRYDVASYRRAIGRACDRADQDAHKQNSEIPTDQVLVPRWHPHQLRHNAATVLRSAFGIEVARVVLGHRSGFVTEIYAELDRGKAQAAVGQIG